MSHKAINKYKKDLIMWLSLLTFANSAGLSSRHFFSKFRGNAFRTAFRGRIGRAAGFGAASIGSSVRSSQASENDLREAARKIFAAGCAAVEPKSAVMTHMRLSANGKFLEILRNGNPESRIQLSDIDHIYVIGAGKAAVGMTEGLFSSIGSLITEGVIVTKYDHAKDHKLPSNVSVFEAGHPSPDTNSVKGTEAILEMASKATERDLVIVCLSGGGSALLCKPVDDVTLSDKTRVTDALLACGCPIQEKNSILKHLSQVKGGQLRQAFAPARCISLILSDVVGDRLDTIASGPTVGDDSTVDDVIRVLKEYGLEEKIPKSCYHHLTSPKQTIETPKPGEAVFENDIVEIVANNQKAREAARAMAESLGFKTSVIHTEFQGDAINTGSLLAKSFLQSISKVRKDSTPIAVIAGGETTMTLPSNPGVGGRNQALALSAMKTISEHPRIALLAAGTDGGDGPGHDAAGAVVTGEDYKEAIKLGLDYNKAMETADSYAFLQEFEKLRFGKENVMHLRDGPTGTNVMDLVVMLWK
ncbi:hypothetical protein AAMO2058_000145900 [Amorphochlora amoebiformis]